MSTRARAPKGGITIQGVFYRGGQFLPSDAPQYGRYNRNTRKTANKARKMQYAPYKWDYPPQDEMLPVYRILNGRFPYDHETNTFSMPSEQVLSYMRFDESKARYYIERYNSGNYWE